MALADSITALGTAIINLVGTRLNRDANNFSTAGTQNLNNMIDSRIGAVTGAPVGTVIAYMGTDEPEGFLLMDGRELSRTTYAALFAVIGTSQGAGDGSTTFNIADMTDGRYLMGSTVAGSSTSATAPRIWGQFTSLIYDGSTSTGDNITRGCCYVYYVNTGGNTWGTGPMKDSGLTLDASRNSSIYNGTTDKILVDSRTCVYLIKY